MNDPSTDALHDMFRHHRVLKALGCSPPEAPTPANVTKLARATIREARVITAAGGRPMKITRGIRLQVEIFAAADHMLNSHHATSADGFTAAAKLDAILTELKRYVTTFRSFAEHGAPAFDLLPSDIRDWLKDLQRHMPSKIVPLCGVAEVIFDSYGFRYWYEAMEGDLVARTRTAARLRTGRRAVCRGIWNDFQTSIEEWCREYEAMLIGAGAPS